jgi:hypothetical protein
MMESGWGSGIEIYILCKVDDSN